MNQVRRAEIKDIPRILELLVQVDMVHHNGRPDIFKGPATKYNAKELEQIGFYNVTLNVWSCNPGAIKFYEAMGLVPQKIGMELVL